MNNIISKALGKIRNYPKEHKELLNAHHFVFNVPLFKNIVKADAIIIGLNPGETREDFLYNKDLPTEESSEFDFHDIIGKSKSATKFQNRCKFYLETENIFLTEFFFWSSNQAGEDKKKIETFSGKFGYKFLDCPHFNFCKKLNLELIKYHNPKIIIALGNSYREFFSSIYNLKFIKDSRCELDKRTLAIAHYEFLNIPFLFTPHWTGYAYSNDLKNYVKDYIQNLFNV